MASEETIHCLKEEALLKHENDIVELKALANFKDRRIEELTVNLKDMDDKLDKIIENFQELRLESAQDDFNIDRRVKTLESKLDTIKWITGVAISAISVVVAILALIITSIH